MSTGIIGDVLKYTDVIRLLLLYKYGGIYIDADSACVKPFDELIPVIAKSSCFAVNENHHIDLLANGALGSVSANLVQSNSDSNIDAQMTLRWRPERKSLASREQ